MNCCCLLHTVPPRLHVPLCMLLRYSVSYKNAMYHAEVRSRVRCKKQVSLNYVPAPSVLAFTLPSIMSRESDYIFFWDHVPSPEYPYSLAVFSQWYPLSFTDPSPSPKDPHPDPKLVFTSSEIYMSKSCKA